MGPDLGIGVLPEVLWEAWVRSCPGYLGPGHSSVSAGPRRPVLSWEADESSAGSLFSPWVVLSVGEGCCSVEAHCQRP